MCKRIQPTYLMSETHNCENSILRTHVKTIREECKYSPFKIVNIAFITLTSGYILIPHEPMEVDALCDSDQQKIKIQGPTKIANRDKCILNGLNIILKLSSTESLVGEIKYKKNLSLPYTDEQLDSIKEKLIPLTLEIKPLNLNNLKQLIDDIENAVDKVSRDRRTRSWTEQATTWLQYLGYAAIGIILVFADYKCGIVELLRKCIPRKICIFCVKTTVTTTPTVHYTTAPTAPTEENNVDCTIKTANVKIRPNKRV